MKTKETGRWGPWEPMRGARRQAEAIQEETNTTPTRIKQTEKYKDAIRNPSRTKPEQMRSSRVAARRGLSKGSSPSTPDY